MILSLNDETYTGFNFTIIDDDQEYSPELVSEVSQVESSGVDASIVEKRVYNTTRKFLEVSRDGHGDRYEVNGIVDKAGKGILREMCEEGAIVSIFSDDCEMIDDDWTVRDLTIHDETITNDDNRPRFFFTIVLKE